MDLYRFKLVPESAWRTPWQSDTLSGMLCGAIARLEGDDFLRVFVIDPALAGQPPFVVSDAFPGDWLPVPAFVRLLDCPPEKRKALKRARWLTRRSFQALQSGDGIAWEDLISMNPATCTTPSAVRATSNRTASACFRERKRYWPRDSRT